MAMVQIGVKIDESIKNKIRDVVSTGKYRDMSDFAAKAIVEKLNRESDEILTLDSLQAQINELREIVTEKRENKYREEQLRRLAEEEP